jgi:peroxiredoxin Q/BCP
MKQGVGGALIDIQNNHPNDIIAMLLFSRPLYGNDPPGCGLFNSPQFSLTNNYNNLITTTWAPPESIGLSTDLPLWNSSGKRPNTPSAHGDYDSNTASSYGFMLAYNQFSAAAALSASSDGGVAQGGLGRKGATRMVIFEADGMANEDSVPASGFTNGGGYNSYYNIRPTDAVNGAGYSQTNLLQVVEAICNRDDGTAVSVPSGYPAPPGYPGYATINKPVIVHCNAYVRAGDAAPAFDCKDDQGGVWKSKEHYGKKYVVLYFYLGDFMKRDTAQACAYRDHLKKIAAEGAEVVGVSGDAAENHQVFKDKYRLTRTLLADEKGEVGKAFGVAMSGGGDMTIKTPKGKEVLLVRGATAARWTWIVGKDGTVIYKNISANPDDDAKQVLQFLQDLNARKP